MPIPDHIKQKLINHSIPIGAATVGSIYALGAGLPKEDSKGRPISRRNRLIRAGTAGAMGAFVGGIGGSMVKDLAGMRKTWQVPLSPKLDQELKRHLRKEEVVKRMKKRNLRVIEGGAETLKVPSKAPLTLIKGGLDKKAMYRGFFDELADIASLGK